MNGTTFPCCFLLVLRERCKSLQMDIDLKVFGLLAAALPVSYVANPAILVILVQISRP